jgi:hypothetical protein
VQRGRALGLDRDDADVGLMPLPLSRSGDEPAAADRHEHDVGLRRVLKDLHPTVPCPAITSGSS